MKVLEMEHYDRFDDEYVCWVCVQDIPDEFVQKAKRIDKDNYLDDCFGVCVGKDENEWYVCEDEPSFELYYVDNNGEKHWMGYSLTDIEKESVIKYCQNYVEGDM